MRASERLLFRAQTFMWAALLRQPLQPRRITLHDLMGAVGRQSGREWTTLWPIWHWPVMTSLRGEGSQTRVAPQPNTSPNGTEPFGRRWVQAWTRTSGLWRQREVMYMLEAP